MHVNTGNIKIGAFNNALNVAKLVNGNTKLTVYMAGGDFIITTRHYMRIKADTYRISIAKPVAKLFQNRNIIYINVYAKFFYFYYLFKVYTIGSVQNMVLIKARHQAKFYFIYTYAVKRGTNRLYIL